MTELRPYQQDIIAEIEQQIAASGRRIIIVAPTGAGKTVIAAALINSATDKKVVVLAHTREIIKQTAEKLFAHGIEHGIVQAGFAPKPWLPVQIASVQTLWARAMRTDCIRRW